jgi:hypothetical protein
MFKSRVGNILSKDVVLRINLNISGSPIVSKSNGPVVSPQNNIQIDVIVDLTFEHWSQTRTRIPSRNYEDVLKPRVGGGVEVEVHNILSVSDRDDEVNGHLRAMTQDDVPARSAESGDVGRDDDKTEDDESHRSDLHEGMSANQNLSERAKDWL